MSSDDPRTQRPLYSPYVPGETEHGAGSTNAEALAAIRFVLGHPPVAGYLYRVGFVDEIDDRRVQCIAEYRGRSVEECVDESGRLLYAEPVLLFAILNPVLAADAAVGTREAPLAIWPLNIWHISPARPGDLDRPLFFDADGARTPGRARIQ